MWCTQVWTGSALRRLLWCGVASGGTCVQPVFKCFHHLDANQRRLRFFFFLAKRREACLPFQTATLCLFLGSFAPKSKRAQQWRQEGKALKWGTNCVCVSDNQTDRRQHGWKSSGVMLVPDPVSHFERTNCPRRVAQTGGEYGAASCVCLCGGWALGGKGGPCFYKT